MPYVSRFHLTNHGTYDAWIGMIWTYPSTPAPALAGVGAALVLHQNDTNGALMVSQYRVGDDGKAGWQARSPLPRQAMRQQRASPQPTASRSA